MKNKTQNKNVITRSQLQRRNSPSVIKRVKTKQINNYSFLLHDELATENKTFVLFFVKNIYLTIELRNNNNNFIHYYFHKKQKKNRSEKGSFRAPLPAYQRFSN